MIITIAGNNAYLAKYRLDELTANFIGEHGELALERIDLAEQDINAVYGAVSSLPLLASRKMVVVRGLAELKPSEEDIEQIISSKADTTDLIIYEALTDKRTAYYKILKSKTDFIEYNQLDENQLTKWLVEQANNAGGNISSSDAAYLVSRVGANQIMLANELDKLLTYESKISRASIDLLVEPTPQSKIFDLLDATFSGNKKRAIRLYDEQRAQKVEPQAILAMLTWQLRLMAVAKHAKARSTAQIAKDSGLSPYPISKAGALARRIDESKLNKMVDEAVDIDIRGKTSALNMDEALKTYIASL